MYSKDDYVIYGQNGVCIIEDITEEPFDGAPKGKLYYVLFAVNNENKIYVPYELGNMKMRKVLNRKEANELIHMIPSIEPLEVNNEKQIEEIYRKAINSNECLELIKFIKYIHIRKTKRSEEGKKMTSTDKKYMEMAENAVYLEIGTALGIKKSEVLPLIIKVIEGENNNEE